VSDLYPSSDLWNCMKSAMKRAPHPDAPPCAVGIEQIVCLAESSMQHCADFDENECDRRHAAYTTAASALLVSEAVLHAADRIVRALTQVHGVRAEKGSATPV
jgi:hypothetical protein